LVGVTGGVMSVGWNRLCGFSTGTRFGCFFEETEPRGGVPGRVKWMVFGRNREAIKTVMVGERSLKSFE
jgi:hypothetical protein